MLDDNTLIKSVLTDKQHSDLQKAVYEYLDARGFHETASCLAAEANLGTGAVDTSSFMILEKKWAGFLRLQKRVIDLERKCADLLVQLMQGQQAPTNLPKIPDFEPEEVPLESYNVNKLDLVPKKPISGLAVHDRFVIAGSDDGSISVWNRADWELVDEICQDGINVTCMAIEPTKKELLATGSGDLSIRIWQIAPESGDLVLLRTLSGHENSVSAVVFGFAGEYLFSAGKDKLVKVWNIDTGYCVSTLRGHLQWIKTLDVSAKAVLASAGMDQSIRLWDVSNPKQTRDCLAVMHGHTHVVEQVKFSGDGKYLASCSRDNTIKLWDVANRSLVQTMAGHRNWVKSLTFSPQSHYIISVSDDRLIKVWDLNGKCLSTFPLFEHSFPVSISAIDSNKFLIGYIDGTVQKT